jgi:hypothetical protein
MFRIYYGNGQVSGTFETVEAAVRELAQIEGNGGMRVQRYLGDGEWRSLSDSQLLSARRRAAVAA